MIINRSNKEENNKSFYFNILFMLNNLPIGSNCIIKLNLPIENDLYVFMLFICYDKFSRIHFYKLSIDYLNNEFYLICIKKREEKNYIEKLKTKSDEKITDSNFLYQIFLIFRNYNKSKK